jgi:hypothetical protein
MPHSRTLHYAGSWALVGTTSAHGNRMTQKLFEKYQDYCKDKERREEFFIMTQHKDGSLEDYVKIFNYNLSREKQGDLAPETRCILFLRGV